VGAIGPCGGEAVRGQTCSRMLGGGAVQRVAACGEWTVAGGRQSETVEEKKSFRTSNGQLARGDEGRAIGRGGGRHVLAGGRLEG
jgi:hypothetical protein